MSRQPCHSSGETPLAALGRRLRSRVHSALLSALAALCAACPAVFELNGPTGKTDAADADLAASGDAGAPAVRPGSGAFPPTESQRAGATPASGASDIPTPCHESLALPEVSDAGRGRSALPVAQPAVPTAQASGSLDFVVTSADDALRAVEVAGFSRLPCQSAQAAQVQELADGYEVAATERTKRCPRHETTLYLLHVSKSGRIAVLGLAVFESPEAICAGHPPG